MQQHNYTTSATDQLRYWSLFFMK